MADEAMTATAIDIREVRTRGDLRRFVAFPERLYARHARYVPKLVGEELAALSAARNPAFEYCEARCWMAFRDGEMVGRIAASSISAT